MKNWSICSVSPELFFSLEGQKLISKPMKGTIKRGVNTNDDLQQSLKLKNSEKDKAENIMIVDMIRNDLGKIPNISSINTLKKFETESFPTLWQMTSTVEAQVKQDSSEIIKAMFQCASITGAPKIKTMEIIKDLECSPRNIYTGSIGLISPNRDALFNVAIRTALIDKKTNYITYGIGSGIVWDSQEKDEYDETLLKSKIMLDQYSNFDLVETMLWTPNEKIILQKYHLERLKKSANFFQRKLKTDKAEKLLNSFYSDTPQKIRLLLNDNNQLLIENSKFEELDKDRIIKIKLAKNHINSSNIFVQHKTTNRSVYDNAKKDFLSGAKIAYETIITSFSSGNLKSVKQLLDTKVYEQFDEAIKARNESGQVSETTFIGISSAEIKNHENKKGFLEVTVSFVSEIISCVKDKDNKILSGDPKKIKKVFDTWTFSKEINSTNPNWLLVSTEA